MDGWMDGLQTTCLAVAAVVVNCRTSCVEMAHVTRRDWCGTKGTQKAERGWLIALGQQTPLLPDLESSFGQSPAPPL